MPTMSTHNHTPYSETEIAALHQLGTTRSLWRQREILLYQHPTDAALLITVGTTFDRTMRVIVVECKTAYATALEYAHYGKIYISS